MRKHRAGGVCPERSQFPLSGDEIRLLTELGFMAATAGHVVPAVRIFDSLRILRADDAFPYVGQAIARLYVGACNDAVRILREALPSISQGCEEIALYLGVSLHLAGLPVEARRMLKDLLSRGCLDANQVPLATAVLAEIEGRPPGTAWPSPAPIAEGELEGERLFSGGG